MLTTTLITLNEEKNIERCLSSVKEFSDEIVLVDSGSTDNTVKIAKKFGAKVYYRVFDNYSDQKNFAANSSLGEWIFSIDADEVATEDLKKEIKSAIKDESYDGYLIPRRNIIFGKEIKYSRWSPDEHVWLWRREKGRWEGIIHEEVKVDGKLGKLNASKIHYQMDTVSEFLKMINRYTSFEAKEKIRKGEGFTVIRLFWDPTLSFFRRFVYKKGFLDGWRGFVLAYLMAIYRLTVWVKVWSDKK